MFQAGHSINKGKVLTTEPIKGEDIDRIRESLQGRPRDLALWSVGTNTALRASDLLALRWDDLHDDGLRFSFRIKERKTGNLRLITLNPRASADLKMWRRYSESEFCFSGQRGNALTVASVGRMLKQWARDVGVSGQISSHSLRKTACRAWVDTHKVPLFTVMHALGHSSESMTSKYIGKLSDDVAKMYECEV